MEILPYVFDQLHPRSILDVGCGTGSWLAAAKKLGISVVKGVDGIQLEDSRSEIEVQEFVKHDLTGPLDLSQKFDLAISLEVAEHLPESAADTLVTTLTLHSNVILFSAAIPGQGGQNHWNEQWPDYWQRRFKNKGFFAFDILRNIFWNNTNVDWWYKQNLLIYATKEYFGQLGDPTPNLLPLVHPHLFNLKVQQISALSKAKRVSFFNPIQKLITRRLF